MILKNKLIGQVLDKKVEFLEIQDSFNNAEVINKKIYFIKHDNGFVKENKDLVVNRIKFFLKKYPVFFSVIYKLFGASLVGLSPEKFLKKIGPKNIILNLGSGVKTINKDVINIDFYPFDNVDIVADVSDIPVNSNSVDAIINESVLEHVDHPEKIVSEIYRLLKPGGYIYLSVPFIVSFHSSPDDYYRWTKRGLQTMMSRFTEIETGVRYGPTSAMVYIVSEWLATLLSFGFIRIQQYIFILLMIVLAPLNILDFLIYKIPSSENIACGFYFVGKKK